MKMDEPINLGDGIITTMWEMGQIASEMKDSSFDKVKKEIIKRRKNMKI